MRGVQLVWLTGIGLFFLALLLAQFAWVRRAVANLARRYGPRLIAWLNPPPEFDQLADDLRQAFRREQLMADVRRLERLLATDMTMSATRQMGNRLAYDWLVRELAEVTGALSPLFLADEVWSSRDRVEATSLTWKVGRGTAVQHAPKVEILEIGWKH